MTNKAIFFDRDGTIIQSGEEHAAYTPEEVFLIPGAREALHKARYNLGYKLFLFTNQPGIAKGLVTRKQVDLVNKEMHRQLALFDENPFTDICVAEESQQQLEQDYAESNDWELVYTYRKPSPRFILDSIYEYNLDPELCYMVGDDIKDVQAAGNAGIKSAAVCSGEVTCETWAKSALTPLVFPSIVEFVDYLEKKN